MLYRASRLKGRTIAAADGEIGKVEDVYFDDERWGVRYLVVNTGGWLSGRRVLISPLVVPPGDWPQDRIPVAMARERVKHAPSVETDEPVSRHYEKSYSDYYGYPYYWAGPHLWGIGGYSSMVGTQPVPPAPPNPELEAMAEAERQAAQATHLRSCNEVIGYSIKASDGAIGHIDDFLIDTDTWGIAQLIVDKRSWLPGGLVLVPPQATEAVDWNTGTVTLAMTREEVKSSPGYDA